MAFGFSERARRVWDEWNIRVAVLSSLFFQLLLIFLANSRRKSGSRVIGAIIWASYLLADWIAAFAIGLISSGLTNDCPEETAVNNQLAAFWAPFLLLHLGGPDAITAFSLEDNELWIRHLMGLTIQILAVVYVFVQSLDNEYWIPTVLVFLAGACKYAERTISLYQACLGNFKRSLLPEPDAGPNYAQLMEEYSALEASHVPVKIETVNETEKGSATNGELTTSQPQKTEVVNDTEKGSATNTELTSSQPQKIEVVNDTEKGSATDGKLTLSPLEDLYIVCAGYHFFKIFKGLVVDHMFSFRERNESKTFFSTKRAADAFKVMEVELNFLYDVLYTKMALVHCKIGYLCRFVCTALLVVCFQQFAALPQHNIFFFDRIVTYVLLGGAIALDVVGVFNLVLSDWALVLAKEVSRFLIRLRVVRRERRWSNTMAQHSFITFCLAEDRFEWLNRKFYGVKESLNEFHYKKKKACKDKLKEFVFEELRNKALDAPTTKKAREIYSARGEYVLYDYPTSSQIWDSLSDEAEYDESVLMWHIATELCYFTSSIPNEDHRTANEDAFTTKDHVEFCKVLSDYMLYLLIMRPTFMSTVSGIAQIRFQDTCAEASKFFKRWQSETAVPLEVDERRKRACLELLGVKTTVKPNQVKGDRSKSLLFDACILANDLLQLGEDRRWEMMSRVWVELVSYAATRCRPSDHARQLAQGGEFITFVWLLMVHFGLGEQFRIEAGDARAKLLVGK